MKLLMWLARKIAARYGYIVVPSTPVGLLPSRVQALVDAVESSGHLGHRYHVRRKLNASIAAIWHLLEGLGPVWM